MKWRISSNVGLFLFLQGMLIDFVVSRNYDCGQFENPDGFPWNIAIYVETENSILKLICLGTLLKENSVITAAQCVCDPLSKDVRPEKFYISSEIVKKVPNTNSNVLKVDTTNIFCNDEYQGFLLNPSADLAILKTDTSSIPGKSNYPVCVDWSDSIPPFQENKNGIFSTLDSGKSKSLHVAFTDYDTCSYATSNNFGKILNHDKICLKTNDFNIIPESLGSGVFFRDKESGSWFIEGVLSSSEKTKKKDVFLAATSVRHYLTWLSHVCARE